MAIDGAEWLAAHPAGGFDEPRMGFGVVECVPPGGMCEDGAIMGRSGERIEYGQVWLDESQAACARYYGWRPSGWSGLGEHSRARSLLMMRPAPVDGCAYGARGA